MKRIGLMIRTFFEAIWGFFMKMFPGHAANAAMAQRGDALKDARMNAGSNQGLIADLTGEIKAAKEEEVEWLASGKGAKAAGDEKEMGRAAKKLGMIRGNLADMEEQLTNAEATQERYLEVIATAGDDLEDDRRDIRGMNMERKMANSEASLQTGFNEDTGFDAAKRNLREQTNRAKGQVSVNNALKGGPKYDGSKATNQSIMDEF